MGSVTPSYKVRVYIRQRRILSFIVTLFALTMLSVEYFEPTFPSTKETFTGDIDDVVRWVNSTACYTCDADCSKTQSGTFQVTCKVGCYLHDDNLHYCTTRDQNDILWLGTWAVVIVIQFVMIAKEEGIRRCKLSLYGDVLSLISCVLWCIWKFLLSDFYFDPYVINYYFAVFVGFRTIILFDVWDDRHRFVNPHLKRD